MEENKEAEKKEQAPKVLETPPDKLKNGGGNRKPLPEDPNEYLLAPIVDIVKAVWDRATYDKDNIKDFKSPEFLETVLTANTFDIFTWDSSEGNFNLYRGNNVPSSVKVGMRCSTKGVEGVKSDKIEIPVDLDTKVSPLSITKHVLEPLSNVLEEAKKEGQNVHRKYVKLGEKPPEIFVNEVGNEEKSYFSLEHDPKSFINDLLRIPEEMSKIFKKKFGEDLKNVHIELGYMNYFGIFVSRTKEGWNKSAQKTMRLNLEARIETPIGETVSAIGAAGGIESLEFTNPEDPTDKTRGWEAFKKLAEWVAKKAECKEMTEDPKELFEGDKITAVLPGPMLILAMSRFLSGDVIYKDMINTTKKLNLFKSIGGIVGPNELTVIIDGRQENKFGKDHYGSLNIDSEGTPAEEFTLIENGKLVNFLNSRTTLLPITKKSSLEEELMDKEKKLMGTARREEAGVEPIAVPTNLYVPAPEDAPKNLEELIKKVDKSKTHLRVVSIDVASYSTSTGEIRLMVSLGHPIQAGRINQDVNLKDMVLITNFDKLAEQMKYIGGEDTMVTIADNLEVDGQTFEVSATAPYIILKDVKWAKSSSQNGNNDYEPNTIDKINTINEETKIINGIFNSKHPYKEAIPRYLNTKRKFLRTSRYNTKREISNMPLGLSHVGFIFHPVIPRETDINGETLVVGLNDQVRAAIYKKPEKVE